MILKRTRALGDCLMLTPIVREYKFRYPDEPIYIDTVFKNVFENNPHVIKAQPNRSMTNWINLDNSYEKNFDIHPIDIYSTVVFGDTKLITGKEIDLNYTVNEKSEVDKWLLDKKKPLVILHLGMTWAKINTEVVDITIRELLCKNSVVIIGTGHSDEYYPYKIVNDNLLYLKNWSLGKIKYLMDNARLFIGTDSGMSHLASASNVPQIVFYGPVNPEYRKPFKEKIYIPITGECEYKFCAEKNKKILHNGECHGIRCDSDYKCTKSIKAEQILEKIKNIN